MSGLVLGLRQSLVPQPPAAATVTAAAFFALAFGVRAPQRLTYRYGAAAWRRFVQGTAPRLDIAPLVGHGPVDDLLCWTLLAVVALVGGVATALMPATTTLLSCFYGWLHAHFLWSAIPLAVLHFVFAIVACLVPCAGMGLAISLLHVLRCPRGEWDIRAAAYVLIGAAAGCLICAAAWSASILPNPVLLAASLPLLFAALVAAAMASANPSAFEKAKSQPEPEPPISADHWPVLLRAGVVVIGGGGACATTTWSQHQAADGANGTVVVATALASLAIGILAERAAGRRAARSIGGFGVGCAAAGIIVAAGGIALLKGRTIPTLFALLLAGSGLGATGYCVSYGREALMARVALRSSVSALTLARLLICAGATVWPAAPLTIELFGEPATVLIPAVLLIGMSGILILHEPDYDPASRRIRLGVVFASVAALAMIAGPQFSDGVQRPAAPLKPSPAVGALPQDFTQTNQAGAAHDR